MSLIKKRVMQTWSVFKGYLGRKADKMQLILVCNTLGSGEGRVGNAALKWTREQKVAPVYVVARSGLFFFSLSDTDLNKSVLLSVCAGQRFERFH